MAQPLHSRNRGLVLARPRLEELERRDAPAVFGATPAQSITSTAADGIADTVLADLTGDGRPEVIAVLYGSTAASSVNILTNPNGVLGNVPINLALPGGVFAGSVAVADFNGDGNLDIVTGNLFGSTQTLTALAGLGGLNFAAPISATTTIAGDNLSYAAMTVADFNGDGRLDIAVADRTSGVRVFINNSMGTTIRFNRVNLSIATGAYDVESADFNGDGFADLAAVGPAGLSLFLNTGSGFVNGSPATITLGSVAGATALTVADFNGDGRIDIATAATGSTTAATLFINQTTPAMAANTTLNFSLSAAVGALPAAIAGVGQIRAADLNGDDRPDLVVTDTGGGLAYVVFNNILTGRFTPGDLVFANTTAVFDTLNPQAPLATTTASPFALSLGDINGDGRLDLLVGTFAGGYNLFTNVPMYNAPIDQYPTLYMSAVVGQDFGAPIATVFYRDGRAPASFFAFPFASPLGIYFGGLRVAVGDANSDGLPDIITAAGPGGGPRIQIFSGAVATLFTNPGSAEIASFFALTFDPNLGATLALGLYVSFGIFQGRPIIIAGAGEGAGFGPRVQVIRADGVIGQSFSPNSAIPENPTTIVTSFFAYQQFASGVQFTSGVRVASGDIDGDGNWDVITGPGPLGGSLLKVFTNIGNITGVNTPTGLEALPTLQTFMFPASVSQNGLGLYVGFAYFQGVPTVIAGVGGLPGVPGFGALVSAFPTVGLPVNPTQNLLSASFQLDVPALLLTTGVRVGTQDFNGDGVLDLLVGAGSPFMQLYPVNGLLVRVGGPIVAGVTPTRLTDDSTLTINDSDILLGGTVLNTNLAGVFVG